jgi:hypothetical protein
MYAYREADPAPYNGYLGQLAPPDMNYTDDPPPPPSPQLARRLDVAELRGRDGDGFAFELTAA